jgi:HAD superfamily hydrolase (TIGR01459 family)
LITSGEVARSIFLNETLPFPTPRHTFWLFGGPHPRFSSHEAIFKDTKYREVSDLEKADFIYISIPHIDGIDQTDPEAFRDGLEKIKSRKLPMICSNPDRFAHEGKPPQAVVRQGSIAKMYEEMGGDVFYIGKPHNRAYSHAFEEFQKRGLKNPRTILMVGDTPETDIRGARAFGMASALTTETGIMADRIAHVGWEKSLNDLPPTDVPNYFIKRFANELCLTPQS